MPVFTQRAEDHDVIVAADNGAAGAAEHVAVGLGAGAREVEVVLERARRIRLEANVLMRQRLSPR